VNLLDVLRATEYVVPAMEIVDARLQNPRKIFDTVADNGAAADSSSAAGRSAPWRRPALGGRHHVPQLRDRGDGLAAGVLGHRRSRGWLANRLGKSGVTLEAAT